MQANIYSFVASIIAKDYKILTMSGPTGVGKTFLLERVERLVSTLNINYKHKQTGFSDVFFMPWYKFTREQMKNPAIWEDIEKSGVLIIPEFLKGSYLLNDKGDVVPNSFQAIEIEKAHEVLDMRKNKPTLIDTNKTISEIEKIDIRVADRLFRNEGIVLNIPSKTLSYQKRNASRK